MLLTIVKIRIAMRVKEREAHKIVNGVGYNMQKTTSKCERKFSGVRKVFANCIETILGKCQFYT